MWIALVGTFAAVTLIFHWWTSRPIGKPRKPIRKDLTGIPSPQFDHSPGKRQVGTLSSAAANGSEDSSSSSRPGEKSILQPLKLEAKRGSHICSKRALLIIAHPDDECMFFAPTILGLIRDGCDLHILCLSSGNYCNQGLKRKVELRHSCVILGVTPANITVVEHTKLPDHPKVLWGKNVIKEIILKYIHRLDADTVISFDAYGVSGHLNHSAISTAIQHVHSKSLLPKGTQVFLLQSVNLLRKYSGLADIWCSSVDGCTSIYISGYLSILNAQRAMLQYKTQLTWYRFCYILLSRYMCINTYKRIVLEDDYYQKINKTNPKRSPVERSRNNSVGGRSRRNS